MPHVIVEAFHHAFIPMIVMNCRARVLHVNEAFTAQTGYGEEEVRGCRPHFLHVGRHDHLFYRMMRTELAQAGEWCGELWSRRKNGQTCLQRVAITALCGPDSTCRNYVAVMSDATDHMLRGLANRDPLTGLPDRSLFLDRLARACSRVARHDEKAALLFLDLDRFKDVNDTLGHAAGDQLLLETTARLLRCVRDTDTVARLGGDEFTIIIANLTDMKYAELVAKKILCVLAEPFYIADNNEVFISASIGIASIPSDSNIPETLVKYADIAMYQAKDDGRNSYRFFSQELNADAHQRMDLVRDIHRALKQDEFQVYYQPIIDAASGALVGAEALLRWNKPDGRLVPAAEFISVAEDTGLIIPIGERVLDKVVDDLVSWHRSGILPIRVSINLSRRQLRDSRAFEKIRQRLHESNIPPCQLDFEIPEAVLKDETPAIRESLRKIADFGNSLTVDNFGTGYMSLRHLRNIPVNTLKIDKIFIRNLLVEDEDASLTDAIIAMAHSLGIRIVAEGVESDKQLHQLRQRSCDFVQGYFVSMPLAEKDFLGLLCSTRAEATQ